MITLFRRIREKLIASGSVSKYLLYAFGEILLVVIGILIALQVNNWNEERITRDRQHASTEKLFQESLEIVYYFRNEMGWMQEIINNLDATAKALDQGTYEKLQEDEVSVSTGLYPTSWPPRTVYDELVNSGLFQEIESDSIRQAVTDYYQSVAFLDGQLDFFRSTVEEPLDYSGSAIQIYYDPNNSRRASYRYDLAALSKNEEFKESLIKGLRNLIQFQNFRGYVLNDAVNMCTIIGKKIGKECTTATVEIENPSPNVGT